MPTRTRTRGRELAFQILFQCDQTGDKVNAVIARFQDLKHANAEVSAFAEALAVGAYKDQAAADELLGTAAKNWKLSRLLSVDRAILRLAAYELALTQETPTEVVLDEAIELAKRYGSDESAAFVNGVLDHLAGVARKAPAKPKKKAGVRGAAGAKLTAIPKKKKAA